MGKYDKALDYYNILMKVEEKLGEKLVYNEMSNIFINIGLVYFQQEDYTKAIEYINKSATMQMDLDSTITLKTESYLLLSKKILGKEYDEIEIHSLIKESDNIDFEINLRLYELLEDKSYLKTAYTQIQEKADSMEDKFKPKFLSYPIPKAIVEEWEKVK